MLSCTSCHTAGLRQRAAARPASLPSACAPGRRCTSWILGHHTPPRHSMGGQDARQQQPAGTAAGVQASAAAGRTSLPSSWSISSFVSSCGASQLAYCLVGFCSQCLRGPAARRGEGPHARTHAMARSPRLCQACVGRGSRAHTTPGHLPGRRLRWLPNAATCCSGRTAPSSCGRASRTQPARPGRSSLPHPCPAACSADASPLRKHLPGAAPACCPAHAGTACA